MLVNTQALQRITNTHYIHICASTDIFCTFRNAFNEIEFNVGL